MSYYTMSNKELSQLIRKTLKESGFTSKDLSVRVRAALYDTSVNITIKNPLVRISEVEEIVKDFLKSITTSTAAKFWLDAMFMCIVNTNMEFSKMLPPIFSQPLKWY